MRLERQGRRMIAAAALLLAGAAPAAAQDGRLLGRVTDASGNAVQGARVAMVSTGGEARAAVTGPTGGFQFEGVAPGEYTLRVRRDGFAPRERRVAVRPGRVATHVIRLARTRD